MEIALLMFDGITALDAIGPYEVLSRVPGVEVRFVADRPGPKRTDNGMLALHADFGLADVRSAGVVVVPGGWGHRALLERPDVLDWLRQMHAGTTWTTSVCTGALLLGAAGILNGVKATTHWSSMERLAGYGAMPVNDRVVRDGKIVSAAGVSAGIDMALFLAQELAGAELAQAIQLSIEYDPRPPFDSGSPRKATEAAVAHVRTGKLRKSQMTRPIEFEVVSMDHPTADAMIREELRELDARYPELVMHVAQPRVAEFAPPKGCFLLARLGGRPVGCGGIRFMEPGVAEVKRMYVEPWARGRGIGGKILSALESRAVGLGYHAVRLETGTRQPEAMAIYESADYRPIPLYGEFKDCPLSVCYEKKLMNVVV